MLTFKPTNVGEFQEKSYGKYFTYSEVKPEDHCPWGALTHKVDVLDGYRFAIIKKTCAWVAVDEDENGNPVMQRWEIKKHITY